MESSGQESGLATLTHEFCTNVGPVSLKIYGDSIMGRYQITVTPQPINGTFKGRLNDGLFDATWTDVDGRGRIIFGFASDFDRFTAIYNNEMKPSHWFDAWVGRNKKTINKRPQEQVRLLQCEWK